MGHHGHSSTGGIGLGGLGLICQLHTVDTITHRDCALECGHACIVYNGGLSMEGMYTLCYYTFRLTNCSYTVHVYYPFKEPLKFNLGQAQYVFVCQVHPCIHKFFGGGAFVK